VYDPAAFNDRLLLGLKGTMSEAELHVLKARLRGGILNKVRRGEYRCPLPTGFVYDEAGQVVLDPDRQVRETIAYFFETFSRVSSACQTVKVFRKQGLRFPSRLRNGATLFRPLTASAAMRTLKNPRYAGAYAYGQRRYRRSADGCHRGHVPPLEVRIAAHGKNHSRRFDRGLRGSSLQWPFGVLSQQIAASLGGCSVTDR